MKTLTFAIPTTNDIETAGIVRALSPAVLDYVGNDDRERYSRALNMMSQRNSMMTQAHLCDLAEFLCGLSAALRAQQTVEHWTKCGFTDTELTDGLVEMRRRDVERVHQLLSSINDVIGDVNNLPGKDDDDDCD